MKIYIIILSLLIVSCNNNDTKKEKIKDTKISLRSDTINVVKLSDTLVIYESTCRGCAYEGSTSFDISDSLNIVRLQGIVTTDNNSSDMAGGSISKDLILVPMNTGTTTIKMYKFWKEPATAADSAGFKTYTIEVRN